MWRYESPARPAAPAATSKKASYTTMYEHHPPPPPFRVLSPGGRVLYEPQAVLRSPPPTRVPEPYKVAPQASSYGRNQRKSSFAIIAETRPPSPQGFVASSRPGSPQLASGRVSPFRGRGFKGPPPRSHSRPHSPDEEDEGARKPGRRSRYDPRGESWLWFPRPIFAVTNVFESKITSGLVLWDLCNSAGGCEPDRNGVTK